MSGNGIFSNRNFRKVLYCPGTTFHPAKPTRNGPNLAENRKIDDFQKILENPEKYPEEFLQIPTFKVNLFCTFSKMGSKIRKITKFQNFVEIALVYGFK